MRCPGYPEKYGFFGEKLRVPRGGQLFIAASLLVPPLLQPWPDAQRLTDTLVDALLVLAIATVVSGIISALVEVLQQREIKEQRLPFKVLGQALQVAL